MKQLIEQLSATETFLKEHLPFEKPETAVILGSGLGDFAHAIENPVSIPYAEIPAFPSTTVQGHSGTLIGGFVNEKPVIAYSGRFHAYEGHSLNTTVLPVVLSSRMKASKLVISNAAGGINSSFRVGDLMVIEDVLTMGEYTSQFAKGRYGYDLYHFVPLAHKTATEIGIRTERGTYLYTYGPNYETKAEIRAFRRIGADAVGMSTAPELWEASRLKLPAIGISLITNAAAGLSAQKLSHDEIKDAAEVRKADFARLVSALIAKDWTKQ